MNFMQYIHSLIYSLGYYIYFHGREIIVIALLHNNTANNQRFSEITEPIVF